MISAAIVMRSAFCWAAPPSLAQGLGAEAQAALVQGRVSLAAVLLRGAWELSRDAATLAKLAQVHVMAGQFDEAVENYEALLRARPSPEQARQARAEIRRLSSARHPFSDELLARVRATPQAQRAFKVGLQAAKGKQTENAIRALRAALVLDPTLPGTYRVLGAIYGELKKPELERAFLEDYLRIRPDGQIADQVRARLRPLGVLSPVQLGASFPSEIWVNGRPLGKRTPLDGLLLPPGTFTVSFVNPDYHIIRNYRLKLAAGKPAALRFDFGVLSTAGLKPWARVRASGRDLGLWDEVGLPAGSYSVTLEAHDGSKQRTVEVEVKAGKKVSIERW